MNPDAAHQSRATTLDDLTALNRELSALVAGGLPLEEGLRQIARDYGGGVSPLAARLAEETAAGQSLDQAIAAQGDALPPVYRAVIRAGLKSGRLAAALEGFAETASRVATLRRIAGQAAIYPLLVFITAWVMLLLLLQILGPSYEWLELGNRLWFTPFQMSPRTGLILGTAVPIALIVVASLWWRVSAKASRIGKPRRWLRWIPGASRAEMLGAQASFADMLQLLLGYQVPFSEAITLAAEASGSAALVQPAAELAAQLTAGHAIASQPAALRKLPPLVRTAILTSTSESSLLTSLRRAASVYRERATTWLLDVAVYLPVGATLLLGVFVVGVYGALVLQPYFLTLREMSQWYWH
jgi:type II secretory pathway component PulF